MFAFHSYILTDVSKIVLVFSCYIMERFRTLLKAEAYLLLESHMIDSKWFSDPMDNDFLSHKT